MSWGLLLDHRAGPGLVVDALHAWIDYDGLGDERGGALGAVGVEGTCEEQLSLIGGMAYGLVGFAMRMMEAAAAITAIV